MNKEYLEALNWLLANETIYRGKTRLPISPSLRFSIEALQRLESLDNAKPSEALNGLEYICKILNEKRIDVKWLFKNDYNTIKKTLLKSQEQEKVLEIIINKNVEMWLLKDSVTLEQYNNRIHSGCGKLTPEEFDTLKRYCNER